MVTQIQLGNIYQSGGKTLVGGTASGIDTKSIIDSLTKIKQIPADNLQTKIDSNTKVTAALSSLKDLMSKFQDASNFLRNPPGVANSADNIFQYRKGSVVSNDSVSGDSYMTLTATPGAPLGTHDITVNTLATRNIKTTNTFALASADTSAVGGGGPFLAGTLTLGAAGSTITLNAGDTLNQVAAKVNAVSGTSHVSASVIQISSGQYRVSFQTTDTGAALNYDILTPNAGVLNVGFAQQTDAVDASMTLDGTTITRSQNSISDLVNGLTFNLQRVTPPTTDLSVSVANDPDLVKQGITNFVDAYNNIKLFASKQTEIGTDGKPTADAVIAGNSAANSTLSRVVSQLQTEMTETVKALTAGNPTSLADIGITFSDYPKDDTYPFTRNILTIDDNKLTSAIASNFDAVKHIFEFDFSSTDSNLGIFSRSNAVKISDFTLAIDPTAPVGSQFIATYVDPADGLTKTTNLTGTVNGAGYTLTGQTGTVLDGLKMIYATSAISTIDVTLSAGLADQGYNDATNWLDDKTGLITQSITSVADQSTRYSKDIETINAQVDTYRTQLQEKYAALESAISSANTLLQSLDANSRAKYGNNN